jgi:cytoskeletal protein CcmA (bactofilin family)
MTSLEDKLRQKLEAGEITQEEYDDLMSKFENFDLLSSTVGGHHHGSPHGRQKGWKFVGSARVKGEETNEPVKVSGKLVVDGSLKCPELKVSGSTEIFGDLTVIEATKISGKLNIDGEGKFGGSMALSGKANCSGNMYFTENMKISGKLNTPGDIIIGQNAAISGKIYAHSLKSKGSVKISGGITVDTDVLSDEFYCSGFGKIGGNLTGNLIEISKKYRERMILDDPEKTVRETEGVDSIPDLGDILTKVIKKFVPVFNMGSFGKPGIFNVNGNIEGKTVDVSYTEVEGDIIADHVLLGPGVVVKGVVQYRESITMPDDLQVEVQQIN